MGVGINGMGRIGRLALRAALGGVVRADGDPRVGSRLDVVHANELKGGAVTAAHLLEFDSIHGRWRERIGVEDDRALMIGNRRIGFSSAAKPGDVPWGDLGCDIVLECTGRFLTSEHLGRLLRSRRAARDRRGAGEGCGRAEPGRRRKRPPV